MKRIIVVSVLILAIMGSVMAGTLANYTVTLDNLASGSVVGKEFVFMEDGTDTFQQGIKIAPTETVVWQFGVRNYDGNVITETNLDYDLTFDVHATDGKTAIAPLVVTVKDKDGNAVASCTGTGVMHVTGSFPLSDVGQSDTYTVEIYWPSNDAVDIGYAGDAYGTTINVSAVATQTASSQGGQGGQNENPVQSDVTVKYEADTAWAEGGYWDAQTQSMQGETYKHKFRVTITNNSDSKIKKWQISFKLPEEIYQVWDTVLVSSDSGTYVYEHPHNYNIDIKPGESITFGGLAIGNGDVPITDVTVDGVTAEVENAYNVALP